MQDGLVVDLSEMKSITVNPLSRTAHIQPGVTSSMLRDALVRLDLFFPGPHVSSVGVAGFILGGGMGWGCTSLGAACDNVVSFTVVVPDARGEGGRAAARLVHATETEEPELFWALRGGAAFVGIVVEMELKLSQGPMGRSIPVFMAAIPPSSVAASYKLWTSAPLPPCVYSMLAIVVTPEGPPAAVSLLIDLSSTAEERESGKHAMEIFETQLRDTSRDELQVHIKKDAPLQEALACLDEIGDFYPVHVTYNTSAFIAFDEATLEEFLALIVPELEKCKAQQTCVVLGKTPNALPAGPLGVWGDRCGLLWFEILTQWKRSEGGTAVDMDAEHITWAQNVRAKVEHLIKVEYFNNSMIGDGVCAKSCYYKEEADGLKDAKTKYDPSGILMPI